MIDAQKGRELLSAAFHLAALKAKDFDDHAQRKIFKAMRHLWESGRPVTLVLVAEILMERGEIDAIGGYLALANIWDATDGTSQHPRPAARL